jgi:hypothetical protein
LKRPLQLIDGPVLPRAEPPVLVRLGAQFISVADTGDGASAHRFGELLVEAGATQADPKDNLRPDQRIVVRAELPSVGERLRAEVLEETADVVLGSARPVFAALLAAACAQTEQCD